LGKLLPEGGTLPSSPGPGQRQGWFPDRKGGTAGGGDPQSKMPLNYRLSEITGWAQGRRKRTVPERLSGFAGIIGISGRNRRVSSAV